MAKKTVGSKTKGAKSLLTARRGASKIRTAKARIRKIPGICGGSACISGTRIPVWILELERRLGIDEGQQLRRHPSINLESLRAAFRYADANPAEIERQIVSNEG
jgi:uncharacterized protein (DUF433 family)